MPFKFNVPLTGQKTKFYTFNQSNPGGYFKGPALHLVIEATDCNEANALAEAMGAYFNGRSSGRDCSCCGDRWSRAEEYDGTETPSVYGYQTPYSLGRDPRLSESSCFDQYWVIVRRKS